MIIVNLLNGSISIKKNGKYIFFKFYKKKIDIQNLSKEALIMQIHCEMKYFRFIWIHQHKKWTSVKFFADCLKKKSAMNISSSFTQKTFFTIVKGLNTVFSAFLGAKKPFFQKLLKKYLVSQKRKYRKYLYHFLVSGEGWSDPKVIKITFFKPSLTT